MKSKYIVMMLDGKESIFIFPAFVAHDRMFEALECIRFGSERNWERKFRQGEAVSAGFVEGGKCSGQSETLDLESRPEQDTLLLKGVYIPDLA